MSTLLVSQLPELRSTAWQHVRGVTVFKRIDGKIESVLAGQYPDRPALTRAEVEGILRSDIEEMQRFEFIFEEIEYFRNREPLVVGHIKKFLHEDDLVEQLKILVDIGLIYEFPPQYVEFVVCGVCGEMENKVLTLESAIFHWKYLITSSKILPGDFNTALHMLRLHDAVVNAYYELKQEKS